MMSESDECGRALIKMLGSTNKKSRDRALRGILEKWLPCSESVSAEEMKQLWMGLFYCFWHSDKAPAQSALAERLASMVGTLPPALSLPYLSSFLSTLRRQWAGIDRLRLDKFYLLIRCFLRHLLLLLQSRGWEAALVSEATPLLLSPLPNGVDYHLASVFLDELLPFLPLPLPALRLLFHPFLHALSSLPDKLLLAKLDSSIFRPLLTRGTALLRHQDHPLGTLAVSMRFSPLFYDLGSSPLCLQPNRKLLFALHNNFSKLDMEAAAMGLPHSPPITNPNALTKCSNNNTEEEEHVADTVDDASVLTESVISNLHLQFEKVAADVGLENAVASICEAPPNPAPSKKRKRAKRPDKQEHALEGAKSEDKTAKKVRFSMKSNLVWKPHSPLPPQSLRIPPSVTPRGSALKKGVSPGPIRDMPLEANKAKRRANSVKGRKKLISVKRPKKLKSLSG